MSAAPIVGVTQRRRETRDEAELTLDAAYAEALREAGAEPLLLPHGRRAESALARLDGLLIPGGPDFVPDEGYEDVAFEPVPRAQLAEDTQALESARQRAVPLLGICYGMQLLALYEGGALHAHIPHDRPEALAHTAADGDVFHDLHPVPGTRLAAILGSEPGPINSRHHQAVSDPGALAVSGRSGDGLIESVESPGDLFVLGVQWHPERMAADHRRALFGAFVEACRRG